MPDINKKKKGYEEKEQVPEDSCCSFTHTEEFLRRTLGESNIPQPIQPHSEAEGAVCGCGCDSHATEPTKTIHDPKAIKEFVKNRYTSLITPSGASCCGPSVTSCTPVDTNAFQISTKDKRKLAEKLGYTEAELDSLPEDVTDISFGCGNPTAIAELKLGEVVLDLGAGGGIDVFLAAKKVGPTGKAIGLDMTPAMIERAQANAKKMGLSNVEFKLGEMEAIPLVDNSVDVIISNCVINLSPDKAQVFRQIYRVLKPGGRLAVSDIVLNGELPDFIKSDFEAWAGCVAGALQEEDYLQKIRDAGFVNVLVESKRSVKELSYIIKQNPEVIQQLKEETGSSPEELLERIVSIKVKATKP